MLDSEILARAGKQVKCPHKVRLQSFWKTVGKFTEMSDQPQSPVREEWQIVTPDTADVCVCHKSENVRELTQMYRNPLSSFSLSSETHSSSIHSLSHYDSEITSTAKSKICHVLFQSVHHKRVVFQRRFLLCST